MELTDHSPESSPKPVAAFPTKDLQPSLLCVKTPGSCASCKPQTLSTLQGSSSPPHWEKPCCLKSPMNLQLLQSSLIPSWDPSSNQNSGWGVTVMACPRHRLSAVPIPQCRGKLALPSQSLHTPAQLHRRHWHRSWICSLALPARYKVKDTKYTKLSRRAATQLKTNNTFNKITEGERYECNRWTAQTITRS